MMKPLSFNRWDFMKQPAEIWSSLSLTSSTVNELTAYSDSNDVMVKEQDMSQWREERMKMSNIIEELESRCKMLAAENRQLETMMHKCRTEYEVDTTYLKNQVKNERERQIQWKELYFKAYHQLSELKRQSVAFHHNHHSPTATNSSSERDWRSQRIRSSDSGCQECEEERKRKASESEASGSRHSSSQSLYQPHPSLKCISVSTASIPPSKQIHHSPIEKIPNEEQYRPPGGTVTLLPAPPPPSSHNERPSFPIPLTTTSQVYKPSNERLIKTGEIQITPPSRASNTIQSPLGASSDTKQQILYHKCHLCDQRYDSEQKLRFHMELHPERFISRPPPTTLHRNEFSGLSQTTKSGIYLSSADAEERYITDFFVCPECNQSFAHDETYRQHLTLHIFKCRYCHLNLENEMNYLVHIKGHTESINSPPFFCFLCDKPFAHVSHLIRHIRSHPDEHPMMFQCNECGKQFTRKGHLTRHMTNHNQTRPYACAHCDKTFGHRTHLRRHEIVHSGLRPHQCKVCHQSFSRKSSLSRHYFIHTTEKPFVCPVCEKGFNRKGRLKNHLKIHIREGYPELVNYVIERRPITKEFIEKINQVSSDSPTRDISVLTPEDDQKKELISYETREYSTDRGPDLEHMEDIKEESEESSDEESDEGEMEGDINEDIRYYQSIKTETNNNNLYEPITTSHTIVREEGLSTSNEVKISPRSPPQLNYEGNSPINTS